MRTEHIEKWIPINECTHCGFYKIEARNFGYGVFVNNQEAHNNAFIGIRTKFGGEFLAKELHWDEDDHYGTAKPLEFIEACPYNYDTQRKEMFKWIEEKISGLED